METKEAPKNTVVTFTKNYWLEDGTAYEAGKTYTVAKVNADRYIAVSAAVLGDKLPEVPAVETATPHAEDNDPATRRAAQKAAAHDQAVHDHETADDHKRATRR